MGIGKEVTVEPQKRNAGAIAGGVALIAFGLLVLLGQIFARTDFWKNMWPIFPIALGVIFYVVMFAGGKGAAGFAIPATIITMIGLILLFQNLTGQWETWSYAWALIVFAVGLGIYIMGLYTGKDADKKGGKVVMRVGLILFLVFGTIMELIFANFMRRDVMKYVFPAIMILLGVFLIFRRRKPVEEAQPLQPMEESLPPQPPEPEEPPETA